MQGRENEYSGHCSIPCDKLQKLSEMVAEMNPQLEAAVEGVSNFRAFQVDVRKFIDRQDQQAIDLAAALAKQDKEDAKRHQDATDRRKRDWRLLGAAGVVVFAVSGFLATRAWDAGWALYDLAKRAPQIEKLTDDWIRYYAQPPATPPIPKESTPDVKHKSFWAQPLRSVKSHQQPTQYAGADQTAP